MTNETKCRTDLFKMGKNLTGISSSVQMRKKHSAGAKEKNRASPGSPPPPMKLFSFEATQKNFLNFREAYTILIAAIY